MSAQALKLLLIRLNANGIYVEVRAAILRKNKNFQTGDSLMQSQMLRSQLLHYKKTWWIRSEKEHTASMMLENTPGQSIL